MNQRVKSIITDKYNLTILTLLERDEILLDSLNQYTSGDGYAVTDGYAVKDSDHYRRTHTRTLETTVHRLTVNNTPPMRIMRRKVMSMPRHTVNSRLYGVECEKKQRSRAGSHRLHVSGDS